MKTYVVGPQTGYSRFIENCELVDKIEDAQVILFTGGEDINPEIYHCKKHPSTYFTRERDREEISAFKKVRPDQLAVGVCRGVQLFCALYGGKLVQDCSNHWGCGRHEITNGKETYVVTSIHHQMQYPFELKKEDYDVLFWSKGISNYYEGEGIDSKKIEENGEPEVTVYHRKGLPTCFGVQGHPEMMGKDDPFVIMVNNEIKKLCKKLSKK